MRSKSVLLVGFTAIQLAGPAPAQTTGQPSEPTTIQEDLDTLVHGQDMKVEAEAYIRLLERGPAVATAIEAALDSPEVRAARNGWAFVSLLDLLGEVGEESHVPRVAAMAGDEDETVPLRKMAFQVLGRLPAHPAAPAAAEAVLEETSESPDLVKMAALLYLGDRPSPRARAFAQKYRDDEAPAVRGAALYLAATLGEPGTAARIRSFLEGRRSDPIGQRLVRATARMAAPQQLEVNLPDAMKSTSAYRSAELLARARAAEGAERAELCRKLLGSRSGYDRRDAIACLVEEGRSDLLEPLLQPGSNPLVAAGVRNELRRLGLRTVQRGGRVVVEAEGR